MDLKDITVLFLKYFGIFYIIFSIAMFFNKKLLDAMMTTMKDESKLFLLAMFTLLFSLPVVVFHNIWDSYLTGFVSFMGWSGLLKGFIFLAFPNYIKSKVESKLTPKTMKIRAIFAFVFGVVLLYFSCNASCLG
jgi:hypothetical protein